MNIFTDECVNKDIIDALNTKNIRVIDINEANLQGASDTRIFAYAIQNSYIFLTFDKDFGNILRFNIKNAAGVVIIYVEDMTKEEILNNTLNFFEKFDDIQLKGKLFIIEKNRIRSWP